MTVLRNVLVGFAGLTGVATAALVAFTASSIRRAERLVPADGRFLDVDGGRLHYTDHGSGQPILLIHGLGGQLRNFAQTLIWRLGRSHRVIALDRPGSGYSTVKGDYPDLAGQAAMVAELVERLALGPVVLAGHSLGGALSLALALERPDLVSSLALIAPLTQHQSDAPPAFKILTIRSAFIRKAIGWTIVSPFGRLVGSRRRGPVFAPDPVPSDFESRGGGALLYRPQGFDAASRDIQAIPASLGTLVALYPTLQRPVSILFGRGDHVLDPTVHGEGFVAQVPSARLRLIDGGHMLPFTHPEATAEWIEGVVTRSGP